MNKKGFVDLEEINWVALILGVVAGAIAVIVSKRMDAGIVMRIINFVVIAIVGYFMSAKILGD